MRPKSQPIFQNTHSLINLGGRCLFCFPLSNNSFEWKKHRFFQWKLSQAFYFDSSVNASCALPIFWERFHYNYLKRTRLFFFFFFTLEIWTFVVSSHNKLQYQDPHISSLYQAFYTHIMNHKPSPNVLKYSPTWNQNKILNIIPLNIKIFLTCIQNPFVFSHVQCFYCNLFLCHHLKSLSSNKN